MRRTPRKVVLVPLVAAAMAVAGCSSTIPGTAAPAGAGGTAGTASSASAAPTSTDDPVVWVDQVCGALLPFIQTASEEPPLSNSSDPAELVKGLSTYLGKASDAAGTAVDGMKAAGPSPIKDGDKLVSGLSDTLGTFQKTFGGVKSDIDKLDTSDPLKLASALPNAIGPLAELSNLPNPTADFQSNPELEAASKKAAKCQEIEKTTG
jgi:hypothetical protein